MEESGSVQPQAYLGSVHVDGRDWLPATPGMAGAALSSEQVTLLRCAYRSGSAAQTS